MVKVRNVIRFDLIDTNEMVHTSRPQQIGIYSWYVDSIELVCALHGIARRTALGSVVINLRTKHLPLTAALDVAYAVRACVQAGISVAAFSDHLDFSNLLAMAFCHIRCSPPLAGPVDLSLRFRHVNLACAAARLGIDVEVARSGVYKYGAVDVATEGIPRHVFEWERDVAETIVRHALSVLQEGTGVCLDSGKRQLFAAATELAQLGLLTHVMYEDFLGTLEPGWIRPQPGRSVRLATSEFVDRWLGRVLGGNRRLRSPLVLLHLLSSSVLPTWDNMSRLAPVVADCVSSDRIRGVLLVVDCIGGDLSDADRLWCLLARLRRHVPVVAYVRTGTSGACCVATAATKTVVNPCGLLGGISTAAFRIDASALLKRLGVDVSDGSGFMRDGDEDPNFMTGLTRHVLDRRVELGAQLLVARVAEGRGLDPDQVSALADGRPFDGESAAGVGLADEVGSLTSAIDILHSMSGEPASTDIDRAVIPGTQPLPG